MNVHPALTPSRASAARAFPRLLLAAMALAVAGALPACTSQLVCASGEVEVSGRCVSLQSDPQNCGAVGRACASGESCSAGLCCLGSQCPPAVYAACFNTSSVQGATSAAVPVGAPVGVDFGPIALTWSGTDLWVANSMSNTLDRLRVSPSGLAPVGTLPTITVPVSGPFSDLEAIAERDGLLYVSNAAVGSLLVVDPSKASPIVGEVLLGDFSFPQGIAFQAGKAYVSLNGTNEIAVVDLATRTVSKRVSVAALASPGASAMPSRILVSGNRAYVALWNLDASTFSPAGHGRLAVLDTTTDALVPGVNPVDLGAGCLDPAGLAVNGNTLWVTCGFFPFSATSASDIQGAAILPVDLSGTAPVVGTAVSPGGHAPGAITFCNGTGFLGDRFSGAVLRFDPAARAVTGSNTVCPASSFGSAFVADLACGK